MSKILFLFLIVFTFSVASDLYYFQNGKKVYLTPLSDKTRAMDKNTKFYTTPRGETIGISDTILVKTVPKINIEILAKKYNVKVVKRVLINVYLLQVDDISKTLDFSNKLFNDDNIIYAHPNFLRKKTTR